MARKKRTRTKSKKEAPDQASIMEPAAPGAIGTQSRPLEQTPSGALRLGPTAAMLLAAAAASPCALAAAAQWSDPSRAAALCLMLSAPIAFGFPLLRLRLPAGAKAWGRLAIASSLAWAWLAAALFAATPLANAFEPLEIYEAEAVSKKCSGGECRVGLFEHRQNKHFHALLKEQAAPEVGELAADCWRKSWAGLHRWRFEKGGPCGSRIQAAGAVPPGTGASIRARH